MTPQSTKPDLPSDRIARSILVLRGHKVLLDADLAALYGVTTKCLNEQVRRNLYRFPDDFMFQLNGKEIEASRSQIATLKPARGKNLKYRPLAVTEHATIMAASVLNSPSAVEMSVYVVRAFVRLREIFVSNQGLAKRLDQLLASIQRKLATHDESIGAIISAIRELMIDPPAKRRGIGFTANLGDQT